MAQANETFFTVVGCMDGRCQKVLADFGRQKFGTKYPDTITEAGIVGLLAKAKVDQALAEAIKFKVVDVSIGKHHATGVLVSGHAECAGNPVDDTTQKKNIQQSVTFLKNMVPDEVPIIGVFVKRSTSGWEAEELS